MPHVMCNSGTWDEHGMSMGWGHQQYHRDRSQLMWSRVALTGPYRVVARDNSLMVVEPLLHNPCTHQPSGLHTSAISLAHISLAHISLAHISLAHISHAHISLAHISLAHISLARLVQAWHDGGTITICHIVVCHRFSD